ncbi:MAG: hypothetical protein WC878_01840 [Candidatus Paceibacterota bacterium]
MSETVSHSHDTVVTVEIKIGDDYRHGVSIDELLHGLIKSKHFDSVSVKINGEEENLPNKVFIGDVVEARMKTK